MIGVLQIVLAQHPIARTCRITRKLQITFVDMRSRPTDFRLWPVALHLPVRVVVVLMMAAATTATRSPTAATLTLHEECTILFVRERTHSARAKGQGVLALVMPGRSLRVGYSAERCEIDLVLRKP